MRLTKNDMARVVVQALHALPSLPEADERRVVRMARREVQEHMRRQHELALKVIGGWQTVSLPVDQVPKGSGWKLSSGNTFMNLWVRP